MKCKLTMAISAVAICNVMDMPVDNVLYYLSGGSNNAGLAPVEVEGYASTKPMPETAPEKPKYRTRTD